MKKKLLIFIPTYNAEKTLSSLVERIPLELWDDSENTKIHVIDDGSSDKTTQVVHDLKTRFTALQSFSFPQNQGYGKAVAKGIALARKFKADYAVCLHSDGQYPPEYIPQFVAEMLQNNLDILQGSRHLGGKALEGGMPFYKYVAGKLLCLLENQVFHLNMSDYHSGFLFYSAKALDSIPFDKLSASFDFDLEVIACAKASGLIIDERAIPTRYAGEISHLRPIHYGLRVLKVLWKYWRGKYQLLLHSHE